MKDQAMLSMAWLRSLLAALFLLGAPLALAQDRLDGDSGGAAPADTDEEEGAEIIIDGEGSGDGAIDIEVDPFEKQVAPSEPNRPVSVRVGTWPAPKLTAEAERERQALIALCAERPDDLGPRYRLAEFYLEHRWFPHAEAEFLACARREPDSIRPWEGLLRVYRERPRGGQGEGRIRVAAGGGVIILPVPTQGQGESEPDWLATPRERDRRITRAFAEIVKRRPDDISWRRAYLEHLEKTRDHPRMIVEARAILARMPDDVETRFKLAEALRLATPRDPERPEAAWPPEWAEAQRLLEENLRKRPDHAASALRLARMIAVREGNTAERRIRELESRALFRLFLGPEVAALEYRPDAFRMVRDVIGPRLANRLWDECMIPDWYRRQREENPWAAQNRFYRRWIVIHFPHAQPLDRLPVIERLGRRADPSAAAVLAALLWHMQGPGAFNDADVKSRDASLALEDAAVRAVARLSGAAVPIVVRFLGRADTPDRRRRGVKLARALGDRRVVRPLIDALAWDTDKQAALGVAAALEELGDPQAIDALVEAALDARRPVPRRREAVEALAAFPDPRSIEALRRLERDADFRLVTAYGMFRLTGSEKAAADLRRGLRGEDDPTEVVRLIGKCRRPEAEALLVAGLEAAPRGMRPALIALLRERYWETSKDEVKRVLLDEASSPAVTDDTLALLAEFGGADVARAMIALLPQLDGKRWALAARTLAATGEESAVRYFARLRILEKNPGKRRLARDLYDEAARIQAARKRSESRASAG